LNCIQIQPCAHPSGVAAGLPSSKSISNRALVLQALGGGELENLSSARDTRLMRALIGSSDPVIDAMDAGTTMRFLTAYFTITNQHKTLTGTARMKERPIAPLVDALRTLGATIHYRGATGFPPIEVAGFTPKANALAIPGNISSQYISALMMIGPLLPGGLSITITGPVSSRPYIEMTARMMQSFGVTVQWNNATITVPETAYRPARFFVEGDWSAASYWYAIVSLAETASITLPGLQHNSLQGDRAVVEIMERLGVVTTFTVGGVTLQKGECQSEISVDFINCPDLAQTVLPVCAARGVPGTFTGLESLRIKETDRLAALQHELAKTGAALTEVSPGQWQLTPGHAWPENIRIATYHDHRMAMGFAPWATRSTLTIENPRVVDKSYPDFWSDLKAVGFTNMRYEY
jgi:3-phosphoshikimate 1-carboxyvinyltransferase